eukprot:6277802-Pyramimonas_sp.AAC.1
MAGRGIAGLGCCQARQGRQPICRAVRLPRLRELATIDREGHLPNSWWRRHRQSSFGPLRESPRPRPRRPL